MRDCKHLLHRRAADRTPAHFRDAEPQVSGLRAGTAKDRPTLSLGATASSTVLGELAGRRLWRRFEVHYTPKHASWLNAAELEASLVSRECLGRRRVSFLVDLISLVAAWRHRAEEEHRVIDWRFRLDDARRVFRYDGLTAQQSEH